MSGRLTDGFRNILEFRWSQFVEMEQSLDGTNFESIITAIARAGQKGNLRAIQTALDRLDGKIATEIEVEMPKFYFLYPYATKTVDDASIIDVPDKVQPFIDSGEGGYVDIPQGAPADIEEHEAAEEELPTGSLRIVLEKMLHSPKSLVTDILAVAKLVDDGDTKRGDPMVKSVIVAGLMKLVHEGKMSAVFEVFDQIDGKVAEKFKVLGNDVYVKRFDTIAPAGAVKNEEGIYQLVAEDMTNFWVAKLEQGRNQR
jgi:hypothetical protein